jgi:competence protein ComGF
VGKHLKVKHNTLIFTPLAMAMLAGMLPMLSLLTQPVYAAQQATQIKTYIWLFGLILSLSGCVALLFLRKPKMERAKQ